MLIPVHALLSAVASPCEAADRTQGGGLQAARGRLEPPGMRLWIFHPLVFYPLSIVLALLVIAISLRPQTWPREPAPISGRVVNGALVLDGNAFNSPYGDPIQNLTVKRNFWGAPLSLRVAVQPGHPAPPPTERGVRLVLSPADAQRIAGRALTVDVSYLPLPVNAGSSLAISAEGAGPVNWATRPTPPQAGTLRFELPPQANAEAIGIRAISTAAEEAYGIEITRIRITPHSF